ncbi:MAG TPA: hypothetical protein VMK16_02790 [Acidimicrobiales bacterium]|nr:hypothetical protein [Acidimicrobiales bacterium]
MAPDGIVTPEQATDVVFPTDGWREVDAEPNWRQWTNEYGDVLAKTTVPLGTVPALREDRSEMIGLFRALSERRGGALFSVDAFAEEAIPAVQWIYKKRANGLGFLYYAALYIDVATHTVVISLVAGERGMTGLRETDVVLLLVSQGRLKLPRGPGASDTPIEGWFVDPYDDDYDGPVLRSIADSEEFDDRIPDHPLTRLRRTLRDLRASMTFVE